MKPQGITPHGITDVCLVSDDLDAAIEFYQQTLEFTLDSRMPAFADFRGPGTVLAVWSAQAIRDYTGVPARAADPQAHPVMLAVELDSPDEIDRMYGLLSQRGVEFYGPPTDYPWNARCIYFAGPCNEFWEFFAWLPGGKPGRAHDHSTPNEESSI